VGGAAALSGSDDDGDALRLLDVDCRWVRPDYAGPAPIVQEDGTYYDAFGTHRRSMSNEFCTYEEYAGHPLYAPGAAAGLTAALSLPHRNRIVKVGGESMKH
jgi:hypothetical protein